MHYSVMFTSHGSFLERYSNLFGGCIPLLQRIVLLHHCVLTLPRLLRYFDMSGAYYKVLLVLVLTRISDKSSPIIQVGYFGISLVLLGLIYYDGRQ